MSKKNKHSKKHHEEEGGEAWLLPYSDLMTLLLAVFIVLFAVSKIDESKAKQLAQAFQEGMMSGSEGLFPEGGDSMSPLPEGFPEEVPQNEKDIENETEEDTTQENTEENIQEEDDTNLTQEDLEKFLGKYELENLKNLKNALDIIRENEDMSSDITTSIDNRGLVISLNNAVLFDSGSAQIKGENVDTLIKIAEIVNRLDNYIRIEGHTDNVPMNNTSVYPSNWELSTARASSVVRLFIDECKVSPEKVVAVGYGEYKPIANNTTAKGREKNRRIDIIVLSEKYNNLEDQITQ